jgi:hypothetical protein
MRTGGSPTVREGVGVKDEGGRMKDESKPYLPTSAFA